MKATTGAAQLRRQSLQWQKHAQLGWPLKLNATRPHRQCPSVALVMIAPIRMLFPVCGIIWLSEGEGNPCVERAAVILAPAMRVCRTADKTGSLSSAGQPGADLSSADLSSADLSRAELSSADLSRAELSSADRQTSLSGSSWHRSVPWSSSMRCRRCRGKSCVQGQFSKQLSRWRPACSLYCCQGCCGRRST